MKTKRPKTAGEALLRLYQVHNALSQQTWYMFRAVEYVQERRFDLAMTCLFEALYWRDRHEEASACDARGADTLRRDEQALYYALMDVLFDAPNAWVPEELA